ncbi:hypothetical protein D1AOALGA4SA_9687 [Olavius algarvensis Delta 1 endosymbiont]|nr:hypothetical protein D1AOALGA4SA_9687 [Olavius algarvensis Delta 1 endosymbiont]
MRRTLLEPAPISTMLGFDFLQYRRYNVGWVECNETQHCRSKINPTYN